MTPEKAGRIVDDLTALLRKGEIGLRDIPPQIRYVLEEEVWRERKIRTGKVVRFDRFIDFLTTPPLEGLGEHPADIEKLLRDDPEALRLFREATNPGQGHRTDLAYNVSEVGHQDGNSRSYTLTRLHKQAPDLYRQVVAKELTANQAAIQAGFRKVKTPLEQLRHWWRKASDDEQSKFLNDLEKDP